MQLVSQGQDKFSEYWAHHTAFDSLFSTGWLGESKEHTEETLAIAKLDGDRSRTARAVLQQHFLSHATGDLAVALELAATGLGPIGWQNNGSLLAGGLVVACELGDLDQAQSYAERLAQVESGSPHEQSSMALALPVLSQITGDDSLLA
jgi:hypothetical protein